MQATMPSALPISSREELHNLDDSLRAIDQFYRAFNERDLPLMESVWDDSPEASVITPFVGIARGWSVLRAGYEEMFRGPETMKTEFYDYTIHQFGDIFYAVGRERGQQSNAEGRTVNLAARATNIFHRTPEGAWKLIHHHVTIDESPDVAAVRATAVKSSTRASPRSRARKRLDSEPQPSAEPQAV
jgi:ketosteroid isomerase-like protein